MGNSLEQYRCTIGRWAGGALGHAVLQSCSSGATISPWYSLLVLVVLLVMAGVEANPGPVDRQNKSGEDEDATQKRQLEDTRLQPAARDQQITEMWLQPSAGDGQPTEISRQLVALEDGLRFEDHALQAIRQAVQRHRAVVVSCEGKTTSTTAAKVRQTLTSDQTPFMFVDRGDLDDRRGAIFAWWQQGRFAVLVVLCRHSGKHNMDVYQEISELLCEAQERRLIVISAAPQDTQDTEYMRSVFGHEELAQVMDHFRLDDLTDTARSALTGKDVVFQGVECPLTSVIAASQMSHLDCDTVDVLLGNGKLEIGGKLQQTLPYYVDRALQCKNYVSPDILGEDGAMFVVHNIGRGELRSLVPPTEYICASSDRGDVCRYVIADDRRSFHSLTENSRDAHCLQRVNQGFVWRRSKGALDIVRHHPCPDVSTTWRPATALDGEDNLVVVTAGPGMGKSSLLTHLAQKTKQDRPGTWVIRMTLSAHTKMLASLKEENLTDDLVVDILAEAAGVEKASVLRVVLRDSVLSTGGVVVMIDGIDEVSPTCYKEVEQIVSYLCRTKADKVWLTARPGMARQLEQSFGRPTSSLIPFSTEDQLRLLVNFWKRKNCDLEEDLLASFARQLAGKWLGDRENQLIGIPLQSVLMAEVFEEQLRRHDVSRPVKLPQKIDLLYLYSEFVEKKWSVYMDDKKLSDKTNVGAISDNTVLFEKFIQDHMTAALDTTLTDDELARLKNIKCSSDLTLKATGIITDTSDGRPQFLHRTLAEYFVALWFCQHHAANRQFLVDNLLDERFAVVRLVMDYKFTEDCPLHRAVLDNGIGQVLDTDVNALDRGGRTALHLAVCYQLPDVVRALLAHNCDVEVQDQVLGLVPLQCARRINNWEVIVELLGGRERLRETIWPIGCNIQQYEYINECLRATIKRGQVPVLNYLLDRGVGTNFVLSGISEFSLLHQAVAYRQTAVVTRLLELGVEVAALDHWGRTALHLCAEGGDAVLARLLLDSSGAQGVVNLQEKRGQTALHVAARFGRLEIARLLIENKGGVDIVDWRGHSALIVAALNGQLEVARLLIDSGSDTDIADRYDHTALHAAAEADSVDVARLLLDSGCDADAGCRTPLHVAAEHGSLQMARLLIALGDVDYQDGSGYTPLFSASEAGQLEVARLLVDSGCDVNMYNYDYSAAIHLAAQNGHLEIVRLLIDSGFCINGSDYCGSTALHLAAEGGHLEVVRLLVDRDCDVNVTDNNGSTPLHVTTENGHLEVARLLVDHGCDVNSTEPDGSTALHVASSHKGRLDIALLLVDHGCDVIVANVDGWTALHVAAKYGGLDVVRLLVDSGSDVNLANKRGSAALCIAAQRKNPAVVRLLVDSGSDVSAANNEGRTALHVAAEWGNLEVARVLVDSGGDLDTADGVVGRTALHAALHDGHWGVARLLIDSGSDLSIADSEGLTALHVAAHNGGAEVAGLLIDSGSDVRAADLVGRTALHLAAQNGHLEVARVLVDSTGIDLDVADNAGMTALHVAAQNGNSDVARLLVSSGCDTSVVDDVGRIAMDVAAQGGHVALTRLYSDGDSDVGGCTPLHAASRSGDLEAARRLVGTGLDTNVTDDVGRTALHLAAQQGHRAVADLLLKAGCDVNTPDVGGRTALFVAAQNGHFAVAHLLVEHRGCDVQAADVEGSTALHVACRNGNYQVARRLVYCISGINSGDVRGSTPLHLACQHAHLEVMRQLIKFGGHVDTADSQGRTPLHLAAHSGYLEVVRLLVHSGCDVTITDGGGSTALDLATRRGQVEVARLLTDSGNVGRPELPFEFGRW